MSPVVSNQYELLLHLTLLGIASAYSLSDVQCLLAEDYPKPDLEQTGSLQRSRHSPFVMLQPSGS